MLIICTKLEICVYLSFIFIKYLSGDGEAYWDFVGETCGVTVGDTCGVTFGDTSGVPNLATLSRTFVADELGEVTLEEGLIDDGSLMASLKKFRERSCIKGKSRIVIASVVQW